MYSILIEIMNSRQNFMLSLNGKDGFEQEDATYQDVGLVSGDILRVIFLNDAVVGGKSSSPKI